MYIKSARKFSSGSADVTTPVATPVATPIATPSVTPVATPVILEHYPWFKSPVPRTVIRTSTMLKEYLDKEHKKNRMLDVDGSEFSFKRRYGLQEKYPRNKDSLSEPEVCDVWLNVFKST